MIIRSVQSRTRRQFLRSASAGAAVLAASGPVGWVQEIQSKPGTARVWGTYANRRHTAVDALVWQPLRQQAPDAIVLDPST